MKRLIAIWTLAMALCIGAAWHYQTADASSPQVLVGPTTVTLANSKLSLADTYSFFDFGVDLTDYVGQSIEICNTSNRSYCVGGVIGTVGTGETLSAERITSWNNRDDGNGYETLTVSVPNISSAVNSSGNGFACTNQPEDVVGNLVYVTATLTLNSGTAPKFGICNKWYCSGGCGYSPQRMAVGANAFYRTVGIGCVGYSEAVILVSEEASNFSLSSTSVKQVLTPSATGHWIRSIPSAADGNAYSYKHASFDPNQASGFTYRILSTNVPGRLIASGTVASADCKLSVADTTAMVELGGVDLSGYAGNDAGGPVTIVNPKSTTGATMTANPYYLVLEDSTGKTAGAYVGAVGGGETLSGSELIDTWQNDISNVGYRFETLTLTGANIDSAINTTSLGLIQKYIGTGHGGKLYKFVHNETLNSGSGASSSFWMMHVCDWLCSWPNTVVTLSSGISTGDKTNYKTLNSSSSYIALFNDTVINFSVSGVSLQRVTDIAATGVHLFSTAGGTTQNMARVESGFNPNGVTKYRIYKSY
jgi:hypothetical protein